MSTPPSLVIKISGNVNLTEEIVIHFAMTKKTNDYTYRKQPSITNTVITALNEKQKIAKRIKSDSHRVFIIFGM